MPLAARTAESGSAKPLIESSAPPLAAEFSQPRPATPLFAQGQGVACVPSPKQKGVVFARPRSRRKTSVDPFVSPVTRSVALLSNAIQRPSAESLP
jgi:hypothetical protein